MANEQDKDRLEKLVKLQSKVFAECIALINKEYERGDVVTRTRILSCLEKLVASELTSPSKPVPERSPEEIFDDVIRNFNPSRARALRAGLGINQGELADQLGIGSTAISKYEAGDIPSKASHPWSVYVKWLITNGYKSEQRKPNVQPEMLVKQLQN